MRQQPLGQLQVGAVDGRFEKETGAVSSSPRIEHRPVRIAPVRLPTALHSVRVNQIPAAR